MRTNVDWTQGLNPEQKEAVLHTHGPLLILAGAGSGKTTVLVSRTGQILQADGCKPNEICVLTFTTKAARELKHRVAAKVGASGARLVDHMRHDKKMAAGTLPFLLARGIGQTYLDKTVDLADVETFLDAQPR